MMTIVAREGWGWDLLVERAIKWPEVELHLQTVAQPQRLYCNEARGDRSNTALP